MWHSYTSVLVTRWFTQVSFLLPHWIEVRDDIPGAVLQYENWRPSHWGVEGMQRATHLPVCSSLSWETSLFQDSWIFLKGPEQNSIFNLLLLFYIVFALYDLCSCGYSWTKSSDSQNLTQLSHKLITWDSNEHCYQVTLSQNKYWVVV